jgi:hypothetical protein
MAFAALSAPCERCVLQSLRLLCAIGSAFSLDVRV